MKYTLTPFARDIGAKLQTSLHGLRIVLSCPCKNADGKRCRAVFHCAVSPIQEDALLERYRLHLTRRHGEAK